MEVDAVDSKEVACYQDFIDQPTENDNWNGKVVSTDFANNTSSKVEIVKLGYKKKRQKEIAHLKQSRPDKHEKPQQYYESLAREEQLKFEIELKESTSKFLNGNPIESLSHYRKAKSHLNKRTEYEEKAAQQRNRDYQQGKNPSNLNIDFINNGGGQLSYGIRF